MVRTRFAPSPTGFLHIGGVRTALFNWLLARRRNGHFILRIDDTDQERNVEQALEPILHGFRWLGIDWDEGPEVGGDSGPYYQSQRHERYQEAVEVLLARGFAYRDFATPEELQAEREIAQAEKRRFIYSRQWLAETPADAKRFEAEGRSGVVRLKMPRQGSCLVADHIRGDVEFEWAREQDHVIQRADGTCLYHLANVVDDHHMGITHVVRAEEHLSNTPRQIYIARGLDYTPPEYAHLPFVAETGSKSKLSKRKLAKYLRNPEFAKLAEHGRAIADAIGHDTSEESFSPVIVDFYETVGFLPQALLNYLLLLGWSLDDHTEFFSIEEMIQHFSLERVQKSPASFDPVKLLAFQEHYMNELSLKEKRAMTLPFLQKAGLVETPTDEADLKKLDRVLQGAADRIKIAGDIFDYREFFQADDQIEYDEKAVEKRLRKLPETAGLLRDYRESFAALDTWTAVSLEAGMRTFVDEREIKLGAIIHAARVAVTGKAVGFGMFETLEVLGRESCLARIDRVLAQF